ncbi:hypothetical protein D3C84_1048790 [compost metagenome]
MIAAHQVAVFDIAQGERGAAMGAEVFHRRDLAFMPPVKNHLLTTDLATQGLVGDFIGGAGNVPGIFGVHEGSPGGCCFCLWIH